MMKCLCFDLAALDYMDEGEAYDTIVSIPSL